MFNPTAKIESCRCLGVESACIKNPQPYHWVPISDDRLLLTGDSASL